MKWFRRILVLLVLGLSLNMFVQPNSVKVIGERIRSLMVIPTIFKTEINATMASQTAIKDTSDNTPIETVVNGNRLKRQYNYYFAKNVPIPVKKVFFKAVSKYNQLHIVKLNYEKKALDNQKNQIKFYVYDKPGENDNGTIELGLGGPQIYPLIGGNGFAINHGEAGLNIQYTESIQESVAMHEIGHVLGLDHSYSRSSIMYPIDQGHTNFSPMDLKALHEIYK